MSRPDRGSHRLGSRLAVSPLLGSLLALAVAGSFSTPAVVAPTMAGDLSGWFGASGGSESDLLLDPGRDPFVVPGGVFFEVNQGLAWNRALRNDSRVGVLQRLSWQRYVDVEDRTLLSASAEVDIARRLGSRWLLRGAVGGSFFDDAAFPTTRRWGGGGDATLTYFRPGWRLEMRGGWRGRRYPDLEVVDSAGTPGPYEESVLFVEPTAMLLLGPRTVLRISGSLDAVDARDPLYDARALAGWTALWWKVTPHWTLTANALLRTRSFTNREPGLDEDTFAQVGAGFDRLVGSSLSTALRYTFARYRDTAAGVDESHRISLSLTWRFGPQMTGSTVPPSTTPQPLTTRAGQLFKLRLRAPAAERVAVVGDFNGWDPTAEPLRSVDEGWWETDLSLPAGVYQYAFWVDGQLVTPPDVSVVVPDGFGGRNGLLEVLP